MVNDAADVMVRADELGDALKRAMDVLGPGAFYNLLVESNALIRQITRLEYGDDLRASHLRVRRRELLLTSKGEYTCITAGLKLNRYG